MRIAVTGASGMIGTKLSAFLTGAGHDVRPVSRSDRGPGTIRWSPADDQLDPADLRGIDAVVHLAGESIASGRWNDEVKARIMQSRSRGTSLLSRTLAGMDDGPRVLVSASAIGYYGDRGEEILDEDAEPGEGFLADVCKVWESATDDAEAAGVRVVHPRIGIVQSPDGGSLQRQLPLFKAGLGGRLGSGDQWWSWVSVDDVVGIIHHALVTDDLSGAVNATAPEPVTNAEFTDVLGRVLGRPTIARVPAFGPRLVFGEMADALIFASARVLPQRTLASGYVFRHPTLEDALRELLGRTAGR